MPRCTTSRDRRATVTVHRHAPTSHLCRRLESRAVPQASGRRAFVRAARGRGAGAGRAGARRPGPVARAGRGAPAPGRGAGIGRRLPGPLHGRGRSGRQCRRSPGRRGRPARGPAGLDAGRARGRHAGQRHRRGWAPDAGARRAGRVPAADAQSRRVVAARRRATGHGRHRRRSGRPGLVGCRAACQRRALHPDQPGLAPRRGLAGRHPRGRRLQRDHQRPGAPAAPVPERQHGARRQHPAVQPRHRMARRLGRAWLPGGRPVPGLRGQPGPGRLAGRDPAARRPLAGGRPAGAGTRHSRPRYRLGRAGPGGGLAPGREQLGPGRGPGLEPRPAGRRADPLARQPAGQPGAWRARQHRRPGPAPRSRAALGPLCASGRAAPGAPPAVLWRPAAVRWRSGLVLARRLRRAAAGLGRRAGPGALARRPRGRAARQPPRQPVGQPAIPVQPRHGAGRQPVPDPDPLRRHPARLRRQPPPRPVCLCLRAVALVRLAALAPEPDRAPPPADRAGQRHRHRAGAAVGAGLDHRPLRDPAARVHHHAGLRLGPQQRHPAALPHGGRAVPALVRRPRLRDGQSALHLDAGWAGHHPRAGRQRERRIRAGARLACRPAGQPEPGAQRQPAGGLDRPHRVPLTGTFSLRVPALGRAGRPAARRHRSGRGTRQRPHHRPGVLRRQRRR